MKSLAEIRSCAIHACVGRPSKRRRSGDRGVYSYHRKLAEIIARRDDSVQIGRISADSLMRTHQLRGTVELPSVPRAGPVFCEETLLCTFNASTARDSPTYSSRTTVEGKKKPPAMPFSRPLRLLQLISLAVSFLEARVLAAGAGEAGFLSFPLQPHTRSSSLQKRDQDLQLYGNDSSYQYLIQCKIRPSPISDVAG